VIGSALESKMRGGEEPYIESITHSSPSSSKEKREESDRLQNGSSRSVYTVSKRCSSANNERGGRQPGILIFHHVQANHEPSDTLTGVLRVTPEEKP